MDTSEETIQNLKEEVKQELTGNILPFWLERSVDNENGGFVGHIDFHGNILHEANKGAVLNARILWTFSAAYRDLKIREYREAADRAYWYITESFLDPVHGGVFWELDFRGNLVGTKKQVYAIAFAIYGMAEYYLATGEDDALKISQSLFRDIEKHSFDRTRNGYFEAFTRHWQPIEDLRLSEKDQNENKTMNTHLHILEAYTNLYRAWKDEELAGQLRNLVLLFTEKFVNEKGHLNLFFDDDWNLKSDLVSFGHDIECSWLLQEAAEVLEDDDLVKKTKKLAVIIAGQNMIGLDSDGGLYYEYSPSRNEWDTDKHWWPQAEAVVGYYNAYRISGDEKFLSASLNNWKFIKENIIDAKNGEWHWSVNRNGTPKVNEQKAGFWKCPYHNSRACLEIMKG
ncbi:MAG: AGE family epimerase/isomerase [Bacteroidales bacterium]|nr:AGE family epimerase/isomerase [Bacteroidales bacterium]